MSKNNSTELLIKMSEMLNAINKIAVPIPAIPAIPAINPIPQIPAIPAIPQILVSDDHNLLIKLDTKVDIMTKKVDELSTNTVSRIDKLENSVATNGQIIKTMQGEGSDREMRLRAIESWVWKAIGALIVVNVIMIPIVLFLLFKKLN